ncbi:MAG: hypothetical protein M3033_18340 [Acidobacteriota bacterium]|nr:hypothetical protein [Acidobacteriota bacterium]
MSFDDLIRKEIESCLLESQGISHDLMIKVNELHSWVEFLVSLIIAQQKDACEAAGISPETLRRRVLDGNLIPLSKDGSRLNFVSVKQMTELKPRIRAKRKNHFRKK